MIWGERRVPRRCKARSEIFGSTISNPLSLLSNLYYQRSLVEGKWEELDRGVFALRKDFPRPFGVQELVKAIYSNSASEGGETLKLVRDPSFRGPTRRMKKEQLSLKAPLLPHAISSEKGRSNVSCKMD